VTFVNDRVNIAGGNPCNEALYVRHLTIRSEATVTLDNARVFYQSIDLAGSATVTTVGCGELLQTVCQQAPALRTGAATVDMHRYVSFAAPDTGGTTAVRVTLMDAVGFESFDGQHRWVGPPHDHPDEDTGDPGRTFRAARLQCEPFYTNWDALGTVFVFGAEVVPGSRYALQSVDESCDALLQTDEVYGGSMARTTAKWGDIVEPYDDPNGPAQPDFLDISSIVDKFQAKPGAPSKVRVQLQPNVPNPSAAISFLDIAAAVDAFSGLPYPYAGPTACP
jgi:hypothetical protein